ncbi:MAG: sodium/solute symporter [Bacteroidota bacterium]
MDFSSIDLGLFFGYIIFMMGFGIWIANRKKGVVNTQDYFLASRALPWWAVGGSLIASNISTEQILGMNGSGFAIGLGIATYELMAAATLLVVAKFFLPVFLKKNIYTMPQFLETRFDGRVRSIMAVFWVTLFVFVNISSILYLGGLAIQTLMGVPLYVGILGLVIYSASFSIFGGLKAVVWTDVIQVVVLVIGGLIASWMVVSAVGGGSYFGGLSTLLEKAPEKFDMIFDKGVTYTDIETGELKSAYDLLPGISVLIGGMWIANLYYWGTNQYIIQRALAAKSVNEAQKGVAFAAFMKIMMPLIVVIPGIAAYVILQDPGAYGFAGEGISKPDEAFPWVLSNYVSVGLKGITTAALVAAIGSSISSMVNSSSTIFTLDIYKPIAKDKSETHLVNVGKIAAGAALVIGALMAPSLDTLEQVFQYIQEYTGFISPGILVVFVFGLFWKRATANAGFAVVLLAIPLALALKFGYPDLPFLDRMGFSFLVLSLVMILISLYEQKSNAEHDEKEKWYKFAILGFLFAISVPSGFKFALENATGSFNFIFGMFILVLSAVVVYLLLSESREDDEKGIDIEPELLRTDRVFNLSSLAIVLILAAIYFVFW